MYLSIYGVNPATSGILAPTTSSPPTRPSALLYSSSSSSVCLSVLSSPTHTTHHHPRSCASSLTPVPPSTHTTHPLIPEPPQERKRQGFLGPAAPSSLASSLPCLSGNHDCQTPPPPPPALVFPLGKVHGQARKTRATLIQAHGASVR